MLIFGIFVNKYDIDKFQFYFIVLLVKLWNHIRNNNCTVSHGFNSNVEKTTLYVQSIFFLKYANIHSATSNNIYIQQNKFLHTLHYLMLRNRFPQLLKLKKTRTVCKYLNCIFKKFWLLFSSFFITFYKKNVKKFGLDKYKIVFVYIVMF
jgi:hypothetical protein